VTSNYVSVPEEVHKVGILYPSDTVVREEAVQAIQAIAQKVQQEQDLNYAISALHSIHTALALGRGGVVGQDDDTSLWFYGVLHGAVIDRDSEFSVHT
jgi:hypothetical protein